MHDSSYISRHLAIAIALWTATFALIAAAWALRIVSPELWQWSALLGFTACALSAVSAVLHVKAYLVRVCNLVRNTSGLPEARGFRTVR